MFFLDSLAMGLSLVLELTSRGRSETAARFSSHRFSSPTLVLLIPFLAFFFLSVPLSVLALLSQKNWGNRIDAVILFFP
jgi:uncharacterized membrane protein YdjX (TVP38/TMEM64 family)